MHGVVGTLLCGAAPHVPVFIPKLYVVAMPEAVNARPASGLFEVKEAAGHAAVKLIPAVHHHTIIQDFGSTRN
jgi:hypothetical protein